jgi:predicted HicB family RNase H-like nuclease
MKNLKIQEETHKRLKVFCAENGFKINIWVDVIINEKLDKIYEKSKKKLS